MHDMATHVYQLLQEVSAPETKFHLNRKMRARKALLSASSAAETEAYHSSF